jgi:hypothetical protein
MKVVAVSGWIGSGKDELAKQLIANFGFKRVAYADPLKDIVAEQFGFDRASLDDRILKEAPLLNMPVVPKDKFTQNLCEFMITEFRTESGERCKSFRTNLDGDFFGQTAEDKRERVYWTRRALCILEGSTKRTANPDYWVNRAISTARNQGLELVVISDLRYKNELATTRAALVRGDVFVAVRVNRFDTCESQDPSERDLDDAKFDIVVENRGTLEEFEKGVSILAADIVAGQIKDSCWVV